MYEPSDGFWRLRPWGCRRGRLPLWRKTLRRTARRPIGPTVMGLSVLGLGVLPALGLPVSTAFLVAGVLGLTSGIGAGFYGTLISSAVLQLAPTGQIGRVMGALSFSSMAAVPITYALTGLLTGATSARVPFLVGGTLMLVVAVAAFTTPEVRRLAIDRTVSAEDTSNQNLRLSPQTGLREVGTSQIVAFVGVHFGGVGDHTAAHRAHQQPGRLTQHPDRRHPRSVRRSRQPGGSSERSPQPSSRAFQHSSVRPAAQPYATSLKPISGSGPRSSLVSRSTSDTSRQIRRTCVIASLVRASGIRGRRPASSVRLASKTSEAKTAASCG